jgi:hypothetical protein
VILLFKLIGCLREIGFYEVIQSVIFLFYRHLKDEYCQVNFDNSVLVLEKFFFGTSYFFSVFVVAKSHIV